MKYIKYKSTDKKYYKQTLNLRNDVLRIPLSKDIFDEDLEIEKDNTFYGCLSDGRLIATFSTFEVSFKKAQITAFAVDLEYQKRGIGSSLMAFAMNDLKRQNIETVSVYSRETAIVFYEKCGFRVIQEAEFNSYLGILDYKMEYQIR